MQIEFCATIFAYINFNDEELDLLIKCSEAHYDYNVKALSKQGGVLFGANTSRILNISDKTGIKSSFRDIDRMVSALEILRYLTDDKKVGEKLRKELLNILNEINNKSEMVNQKLANEYK